MKKYILLAAAAISIASCNTEDNYIDQPVAARISATIGENDQTRASDVKWDKGDTIGVSMSGRYFNIKYTENGDGTFAGTTMYFKNKQEPVTVTAYYPFSGTEGQVLDVIEASTDAERQTDAEQPKFDFLYAVKENVTGAEPNINLLFKHQMSKLTIKFINGNAGTDVSKITSCRINGLITEGTFNPVSGVCSANTDTPVSTLNLTATMKDGEVLLPSLILFPQTVTKVTMNISDSEDQEYGCELKFDGNRLESGNNYLFTIKVNKTGLNVEKYAIDNWVEQQDESEAKSE